MILINTHKWETSFHFIRNIHISMKYWMLKSHTVNTSSSSSINNHLISSHLINILLTMFIQLSDHFIQTCIYVVMHLLVLTLFLFSISDPLSSRNLTVSTWPPWAAHIRAVPPFWCYHDNDDDDDQINNCFRRLVSW